VIRNSKSITCFDPTLPRCCSWHDQPDRIVLNPNDQADVEIVMLATGRWNLASIEVEGGGCRMKSDELAIMEEGLLRALADFGAIKPQLAPAPFSGVHVTAGPEGHYLAPQAALAEHRVSLGDAVEKGQLVARLHPIGGQSAAALEIRAPVPGHILRQTEHAFVAKAQLIGNIGNPIERS
jgi:N-alpha-acetyl-L-2,4-diaminobutyrate deacetylase